MPEFKDIQQKLQAARKDREAGETAVFHATEKLKKLQRTKQQVGRSYGRDSEIVQALERQDKVLQKELAGAQSRLAGLRKTEAGLLGVFMPFTDPRTQIGEFSSLIPTLLFPVRLETRFKQIRSAGGALQHQLWVRIFPDECSIDTFDDTLSETEVTKAKNYWIDLWKVGAAGNDAVRSFIENKAKGAWRELMGLLNAGRAYWITQNYRPVNAGEIPVRTAESDVLLIIAAEELPAPLTRDALKVYWRTVFLAQGDAGAIATAFAALVVASGGSDEQTRQLIQAYTPQNLDESFDPALPPAVTVAYLVLPKSQDTDTKLLQWSRARVTTFPDKFVLLGFQKDNPVPVINELGDQIPDPLIIGPDARQDINAVLRAIYGDEFDTLSDDEKAVRYVEYLSGQSETGWLFDFDQAVAKGLGFRVNLTEAQYNQGFERLFVLGVKLSADENVAQTALEELVRHHQFGDSGFAFLPQGTPTNNTEDSDSGYSDLEDADEAYSRYFAVTAPDDPFNKKEKRDGRWLAEMLGINRDNAALNLAANYYHTDQAEARAMNTALWNATLGYFLESMITPVLNDAQRELARAFLLDYVSGRGRLPAIRIGDQPYGILPVAAIGNMRWLQEDSVLLRKYANFLPFWRGLHTVLGKIRGDWAALADNVAYVGKPGDPHQILLDVLGLHASSVEFDQRYAESFLHLFNRLNLQDVFGGMIAALIEWNYRQSGTDLLTSLGYVPDPEANGGIPILDKFFLTQENDVNKTQIDDRPLSETQRIRAYTETGQNYIEWLIDSAQNNHANIRNQAGFIDNKPPAALLYDLLRHALNLEFSNTGFNLYQQAEILDATQVSAARVDANFIGIQPENEAIESKWDFIYRAESRITDKNVLLVDYISELLRTNIVNTQTSHLQEVITALQRLKDAPTARLERALAEHLDLCTYRLDAWLLGFVNLQLEIMRVQGENEIRPGIYLGAYGWVENLKPENKELAPVTLPPDLKEIFDPENKNDIVSDSRNAGYVHAPSINQALTAAVLRNAYISTASPEQAEVYKVNLSSERVRMALAIIEGMQQGQSMGALLGYQLERGLHDNTDLELDIYIYELRKIFPLGSNRLKSTAIRAGKTGSTPEEEQRFEEEEQEFSTDKAVSKIEARNVVDGLALLEHIKKEEENAPNEAERQQKRHYPFGFPEGDGPGKLKPASAAQKSAIDAEVLRLMNIRDAVADLAMAESVHQVVQGNYERAAGALDAYSKGDYPQMPDVIRTPGSGVSLTNRFGIHLPAGIPPAAGISPRSKAEPAVNGWLEDLFPDPANVCCNVSMRLPNYAAGGAPNPATEIPVTMANLGLAPIDLLYMLDVDNEKNLTALDDCILKYIHDTESPRPDAEVEIKHTEHIDGKFTFFELAPFVRDARKLVLAARPLLPTDMMLQNEAGERSNSSCAIHRDRISLAKVILDAVVADLQTDIVAILSPWIDPDDFDITIGNKDQIITNIDGVTASFIEHLRRLNQFGLPQTGFGFIYDRKSAIYAGFYKKVLDFKKRWDEKQATFTEVMNQYAAAPADEKASLLQKAEKIISTRYTFPIPELTVFEGIVAGKKTDFDARFGELENFLAASYATLNDLVDAVRTLETNLDQFDLLTIDIEENERQIVVFAEDIKVQAAKLHADIAAKSIAVQDLLDAHDGTAIAPEKLQALTQAAKLMFGADFQIIPEFTLSAEHSSEIQNCLNNQAQLLDYQINTLANDFPVDEWLYGMARVREKLAAWENVVMLAETYKNRPPMSLTPLQLPFKADDSWLGLAYPENHAIESDKLLYTTWLPNFSPVLPLCGLLVDEWTEVIPAKKETTGLTFHFDIPNNEAPQSLLLVTPSSFNGGWLWQDVVNALHEALDLAKLRAVEPDQIDKTVYAQFLPATVAAATKLPVTMMVNYLGDVAAES